MPEPVPPTDDEEPRSSAESPTPEETPPANAEDAPEAPAEDAGPIETAVEKAAEQKVEPAEDRASAPRVAARLKPARPEPEELGERAAYAPRIPWAWLLGGVGLVIVFVFVYRARESARTEALRSELLETHARELGDLQDRYMTFRERLEHWTLDAVAAGEPERWVDPRLRISGLHSGEGIYLRLMAEYGTTLEGIEGSAFAMEEDSLTRCLGIAPASARGLYESGQFLTPTWVDGIRTEPDLLRLRLFDEQMANAIDADVPVLTTMMAAQYFLLVVQQGENRRDAPVDVYLWDLREEQQLLRARFQGRGILIPVRIDSMLPGVDMPAPPPGRPSMTSGAAHDCSIAAQIKALTGEAPVSVGEATAGLLRAGEAERDAEEAALAADAGTAPTEGEAPPPAEPTPAVPAEPAPGN